VRVAFAVTILAVLFATGCQSVIPHPPTYEDFVAIYRAKQSSKADVISSEDLKLYQALEFTDNDLAMLRSNSDVTIMIGAGIARSGNPVADQLLIDASRKETKAGVAEVWLIRRELKTLENLHDKELHEKQLHRLAERLYRDESENALSYYLMASLQTPTVGDTDAIRLIKSGNSKQFNGYSKETFRAIVKAAESAGYSPYASYHYALGSLVPVNIYSALRKRCSDLYQGDNGATARTECFAMGHNIEVSAPTNLEKLLALAIERDALKGANDPNVAAINQELEQRRSEVLKWVGDNSPPIAENVADEYFRILFDQGEEAALKFAKAKQEK
jgi:hypothetical protein